MTRLWSHIALGVLAVLALGLYGQEQRKRGAAEAGERAARLELDSLRKVGARVDTVFRIQRDTFYVRRLRVDTLTQTVELWKHDTTKVVEYVQQADSTIKACGALVLTCEERGALYRGEIAAMQRRWDARPKPPSKAEETIEAALWLGAGWLLRGLIAP